MRTHLQSTLNFRTAHENSLAEYYLREYNIYQVGPLQKNWTSRISMVVVLLGAERSVMTRIWKKTFHAESYMREFVQH